MTPQDPTFLFLGSVPRDLHRLKLMFEAMAHGPDGQALSNYWLALIQSHVGLLAEHGYGNFKRTLARHYFTWCPRPTDPQIRFLIRHLPLWAVLLSVLRTVRTPRHALFSWKQSLAYTFLTHLLWEYVERAGIQIALTEPAEGNPPRIYRQYQRVSQDLANSLLEYHAIMGTIPLRSRTILELGAGYGRTAFVFMAFHPALHYFIADIPPALWVAETYLATVFPSRRLFRFREFERYASIQDELAASDIAFFLPSQLALLPPKSVDLSLTISSLHEMRPPQIAASLQALDRLTSGHVYLKQWQVSQIPYDDLTIRDTDYPIPPTWIPIYWRSCAVQTGFFEALFALR